MNAELPDIFIGQEVKLLFTISNEDGAIVDLSDPAASVAIIIKRVGGAKITKAGVEETDGTNGKFYYLVTGTDITVAGVWRFQCIATDALGKEYPSTIVNLTVLPRL